MNRINYCKELLLEDLWSCNLYQHAVDGISFVIFRNQPDYMVKPVTFCAKRPDSFRTRNGLGRTAVNN